MTEEFLHYIWKYRLLDHNDLKTSTGENIRIIKQGEYNTNAGPDFFNSRIKVGNTVWAGNVEVHINSSDWNLHKHQHDSAYNNVILHVVHTDDGTIKRQNGEKIPTLELKGKFEPAIYRKYASLKASTTWIPCEKQIKNVSELTLNSWLERLLVNRLERKSADIFNILQRNKNNWEQSFFEVLAKNFGFKVNAQPMEQLARITPLAALQKHRDNLMQVESLLFGQAGLLSKNLSDNYCLQLQKEYEFLSKKFRLNPLAHSQWKFMRMRPVNFPTIRIAQLAQLIHRHPNFFSKILEAKKPEEIKKLFSLSVSPYWETHFQFDKTSAKSTKHLGEEAINNIIINTVCPFLFVYGKQKDEEHFCDKALDFLEQTPSETNSIIKKWEATGIKSQTAHTSQALIELKNEFCEYKKCLSCSVGNALLK